MRAALALALVAIVAGCSSQDEPAKTPEQVRQEQTAARERAMQGAVGADIQALDKAKNVQGTVDAQTEAARQQVQDADALASAPATTPPR